MLCGNCVGSTMGFAKGKGKGSVTDWTDLTGDSDDEPTGNQLQVATQGSTVYERARVPDVPTTALCVRKCRVCGDTLEPSGLSDSCTVCTHLDAMFPIDALARQRHREEFPGGMPPGMPPLMPP